MSAPMSNSMTSVKRSCRFILQHRASLFVSSRLKYNTGICNSFIKHFSTSHIRQKSMAKHRSKISRTSGRYIRKATDKFAGKNNRKKKVWYGNGNVEVGSFPTFLSSGPTPAQEKRAHQLSVVLYEYITSLINSGEISPELLNLGFSIEKVNMSSDFKNIVVHWLASGTQNDEIIEKQLPDCSRKLRSALISMHIIGNIPPITFSRDMSQAKLHKVEVLLEKADMGPDYEPTELGHQFKSDTTLLKNSNNLQLMINHTTEYFADIQLNSKTEEKGLSIEKKDHKISSTPAYLMKHTKEAMASGTDEFHVQGADQVQPRDLQFRQDIYNVSYNSLLQQVVQSKQRFRNRAYEKDTSATVNKSPGRVYQIGWKDTRIADISKLLAKKKKERTMAVQNYPLQEAQDDYFHKQKFDDSYDDAYYEEDVGHDDDDERK